jgi:hypothetical protein
MGFYDITDDVAETLVEAIVEKSNFGLNIADANKVVEAIYLLYELFANHATCGNATKDGVDRVVIGSFLRHANSEANDNFYKTIAKVKIVNSKLSSSIDSIVNKIENGEAIFGFDDIPEHYLKLKLMQQLSN